MSAAAAGERGHIVVTGTSTGIGRATALGLARAGFTVHAGVRREADAPELAGIAGSIEPLLLDITDQESIAAARERVEAAAGGRLAGLVNNAGVAVAGPLEALPIDSFRRQLEVNLTGQVAVVQAMLPMLRAARGRVVFISSIGGLMATPFMGAYHAAKFGIEAVGDSLRQEVRRFGVEVVVVEPGAVATPIWTKGIADAKAERGRFSTQHEELYGQAFDRNEDVARATDSRGVPPERVAETILKALTSARPRTRYRVGIDAKVMARLRALLPDRVFDRLIARATGR